MKKHVSITILIAVCLALVVSVQPSQVQAQNVSAAQRLPSKTYAYFSINSVKDFKKHFNASRTGKLLQDKSLAEFKKQIDVMLKKASAELEKNVGIKMPDLFNLPQGELAVAFAQPKGKPPAGVLFLNYGDHEETVEKILATATKELKANGAKKSSKEIADTRVTVYAIPQGSSDQTDRKTQEIAYFVKDSYFVLSHRVSMIEAVLARWNGRHQDTFANSTNFKHVHSRSRAADSDPQVFFYVNPIDLVKAAITMTDARNQQAAMAMGFIPMFGLDKLKSFGGGMSFTVGEYDTISKVVVQVDMPPTGTLEIFTFPATSLKPPIWVSEKVASYSGANWDFQKAYSAVAATVNKIPIFGPGAFEKKIDDLATNPNGPQIHIKKDFVDNLTGKIHILSKPADGGNPASAKMLFALGTKDEKKMNGVIDKLTKLPGFPGTTRVFQGVTIYEIPIGAAVGGGGNALLGVAVAHGNLMIASDVTMVEEAVRANYGNNTLANSADYKKYASRFPAKTSMISFAKQETQIKSVYEMFRTTGIPGIPIELDFSKLPPFEKIQKYFAASGGYAIPDENGFTSITFSLK